MTRTSFLRGVLLAAGLFALAHTGQADTLTLNDGSVLKGQVLQEDSQTVTFMDHGTKRTLDRSLVASIQFGGSAAAGAAASAPKEAPAAEAAPAGGNDAGETVPQASAPEPQAEGESAPATEEQLDYAAAVADFYQADPEEVLGFAREGIAFEELPVVLYVAHRSGAAQAEIVRLRLSGQTWAEICARFELRPGIFYWPALMETNPGGVYQTAWERFHRIAKRRWFWNTVALTDQEIVDLVNLRFATGYWHRRPAEIVGVWVAGAPFYHIWWGFRPGGWVRPGVHAGWGAGYRFRARAYGRRGW